ncbi:hypothetical protein C8R43DRAFT_959291 [Mycena crocata]|nr:hypothetical protein C8R43DRAFT_959291 [Mycena crocata]
MSQNPPTRLPTATSKSGRVWHPFPEPKPFGLRHAVNHLLEVCRQLEARSDAYLKFITIMEEFENQTIDEDEVVGRVALVFDEGSAVFQEFKAFAKAGHMSLLSAALFGSSGSRDS